MERPWQKMGEDHGPLDDGNHGGGEVVFFFCQGLARLMEEVAGVFYVEDRANADGAEVAHKEGFFPVDDAVGHEFVGHEDGGDAAEEDDHDGETDETWDCDAGAVGFFGTFSMGLGPQCT